MTAGGDQNGDPSIGISPTDRGQHRRYKDLAGYGTGVVTGDEDDILLVACQIFQRVAADGC